MKKINFLILFILFLFGGLFFTTGIINADYGENPNGIGFFLTDPAPYDPVNNPQINNPLTVIVSGNVTVWACINAVGLFTVKAYIEKIDTSAPGWPNVLTKKVVQIGNFNVDVTGGGWPANVGFEKTLDLPADVYIGLNQLQIEWTGTVTFATGGSFSNKGFFTRTIRISDIPTTPAVSISKSGNNLIAIATSSTQDPYNSCSVTKQTGPGTVNVVSLSRSVTGVGTSFLSTFKEGSTIFANSESHTINRITSNTIMRTDESWENNGIGKTYSYITNCPPIGSGSVSVSNGSKTVTGVGTSFLNFRPGNVIIANSEVHNIQSVTSNTLLTTFENWNSNANRISYSYYNVFPISYAYKWYKNGNPTSDVTNTITNVSSGVWRCDVTPTSSAGLSGTAGSASITVP